MKKNRFHDAYRSVLKSDRSIFDIAFSKSIVFTSLYAYTCAYARAVQNVAGLSIHNALSPK